MTFLRIEKLTLGLLVLCALILSSTWAHSDEVSLSPSQDTFVNSKKANKSFGSNSYIRLVENKKTDKHGLIKFDFEDIPEGSEIQSAKLSLYVTFKRSRNNILSVHEVLEDWSEGVNWNNMPDMSSLSEDSVSISSSGINYELDVTAIVQDWVDGAVQNNGLYLIVSKGHIYINSSENSSNQPILKLTYNSSEPTPDPEPVPEPEPEPGPELSDTGVSDSPLQPSNKRIVVVSKDGDGDYARIQDALDDSEPGDTIQVKEGVYVEGLHISRSGTRENPIALVNYPGHSPVIDPGGGTYPEDDNSLMVQWRAEWIILEGFEIRNGWDGIKVYDPHNTIRDNWIHDNRYQGILVVSTGDIFIEGNTVNNNGTAQGACYGESWGGESPRHCHGLYISNYTCAGAPNITVRGNKFRNHGGTGIAWNGSSCTSKIRNTLVENNILENNSWGMSFYYNVEGSVIRNNTLVIEDYPETDNTSHNFIVMWESSGNEIRNNIFYSTRGGCVGGSNQRRRVCSECSRL